MICMPRETSVLKMSKSTEGMARINAVRKIQVLNSQFETFYHTVIKQAAVICNVPVAMLTLVDDENIWISSDLAAPNVAQMPRKGVFCDWVVANDDQYFEVSDTPLDIHHVCHPFMIDSPNFMFYAAAPIALPMGEVIGAICIFDLKPNSMTNTQKNLLIGLADIVAKALVVRNHISKS